jgi:hypothetical protein
MGTDKRHQASFFPVSTVDPTIKCHGRLLLHARSLSSFNHRSLLCALKWPVLTVQSTKMLSQWGLRP